MLKWRVAALTDKGCQRQLNQDSFFISPDDRVFAICDGIGAGEKGSQAAELSLATVAANWHKNPPHATDGAAIRQWIANVIASANESIYTSVNEDKSLSGIGATIVIGVQSTNKLIEIGHVGDSRAYLLHINKLNLLTDDHTEIIKSASSSHNPYRNMVTRCLGHNPLVEASYATVPVMFTDWILLCSDGLVTVLLDEEINQVLTNSANPDDACKELIKRTIDGGAPDNVTAIAIQYYGNPNDDNPPPNAPVPLQPKPKKQNTQISLSASKDESE